MRLKPNVQFYAVRAQAMAALRRAHLSSATIAKLAGTDLRQDGNGLIRIVLSPTGSSASETSHRLDTAGTKAMLAWAELSRRWGKSEPLFTDRNGEPILAAAVRAATKRLRRA